MTQNLSWIESCIAPPDVAPDAWVHETHRVGGRELVLARPRDPDQLLNDPGVHRESVSRDYMPYWAYLWPGAQLLAEYVMIEPPRLPGTRALEIGCGLGLAGLAALATGMHVTFSDYTPAALVLAEHNARLNGFEHFASRLIDWKSPPHDPYQLILGADVLYEKRCLDDVLDVLDAMLDGTGEAWLSDPGRSVADEFPQRAARRTFVVRELPCHATAATGVTIRGRVFHVTR
jgi:predicted nicotinamide N-methyase